MATIIDALLVTLGIDASNFNKGRTQVKKALTDTEKEAERAAKELEARGKQAGQFFKHIRDQVIALTGAYLTLAGITRFSENMTRLDAVLGRTAANIGMSAQELAAWQKTALATGDSAEDITSAMQKMSSDIQEFSLSGQSPVIAFLQQIGLNFDRLKAADPTQRLLMVSKALSALSAVDRQRALQILKDHGYSEGFFNTMTDPALQATLDAKRKLSEAEEADAKPAIERQNAWDTFTQTLKNDLLPILTAITPIFVTILRHISDWVARNKDWIKTGIVAAMGFIKNHLKAISITLGVVMGLLVVSKLLLMAQAVTGLSASFGGLAAVLASPAMLAALAVLAWIEALHIGSANPSEHEKDLIKQGDAAHGEQREHPDDDTPKPPPKLDPAKEFAKRQVDKLVDGPVKRYLRDKLGMEPYGPPAPPTQRGTEPYGPPVPPSAGAPSHYAMGPIAALLAKGEAGKADYSAVNRGAMGNYAAGVENLANMTVAEVMQAQAAHRFAAAGRYQIMPETLKLAHKALGLNGKEKFNAATQDRIFEQYLVGIKRREIADYVTGRSNDLGAALLGMSKEWASVADPRTGKSYYDKDGINHSSITAADATRRLNEARGLAAQASAAQTGGALGAASTVSHETNINGPITVHGARDADNTARGLNAAIRKQFAYVNQANYALT